MKERREKKGRVSKGFLFSLLASRLGPSASSYLAESLDRRECRMAAGKTTSSLARRVLDYDLNSRLPVYAVPACPRRFY